MSPVNRSSSKRGTPLGSLLVLAVAVCGGILLAAHPAVCRRIVIYRYAVTALGLLWAGALIAEPGYRSILHAPRRVILSMGALLATAALSVAASDQAHWLRLWHLGAQLLLIALGYGLASSGSRLTRLVGAWATATAAAGAYALCQFLGFDPLPAATPFAVHRIVGPFTNPNHLGNFEACFLPAGLALLLRPAPSGPLSRPFPRSLWVAALLLSYTGLLLSASRGAWIATAGGITVVCSGQALLAARGRAVWPWPALGTLLAGMVFITLAVSRQPLVRAPSHTVSLAERALSSGQILEPLAMGALTGGGPSAPPLPTDQAINHRYFIWAVTWDMIRAHPLVGIGYGEFGECFGPYRDAHPRGPLFQALNSVAQHQRTLFAHNEFLHMWAECGLLGLLALGALFALGLTAGLRAAWQGRMDPLVLWGLSGATVVMLLHGLVSYPLHMPFNGLVFWLLFGALLALPQCRTGAGGTGGPGSNPGGSEDRPR